MHGIRMTRRELVGSTAAMGAVALVSGAGAVSAVADEAAVVVGETVPVGATVAGINVAGVGLGGSIVYPVEVSRAADARWSWATKPEPIDDSAVAETKQCDVLVLGAGSGGTPAAAYAASLGLSVVVMTKGPTTEACGGNNAGFNSPIDSEYGLEYDPVQTRALFAKYTDGLANVAMMCGIMDRSGEAYEWLRQLTPEGIESVIMTDGQLSNNAVAFGGESGAGTHLCYLWSDPEVPGTASFYSGYPKFLNAVKDYAAENGAEFLFETPAVQLVQDESGAVTGAVGQAADGALIKVLASKGVLLACGDFASNPEMIDCYCPLYHGGQTRNPFGTNTGDGHRMGMWVGAVMEAGNGCVSGLSYSHDFNADYYAPSRFNAASFLRVNLWGERYVNEAVSDAMYGTTAIVNADASQPNRTVFQICDSTYADVVDAEQFEAGVEKGTILSADTMEGLADACAIDAETLVATVERYNALCEAGADSDYGVPAEALHAVNQPPFYAMRRLVVNTATMQGLVTNDHLQLVDESGNKIQGVWACGNVLGRKFGFMYPDSAFTATQKMAATVGGMLAVKDMIGEWDSAF